MHQLVSMVSQCKLMSGWGLLKRRSAPRSGPRGSVKNFTNYDIGLQTGLWLQDGSAARCLSWQAIAIASAAEVETLWSVYTHPCSGAVLTSREHGRYLWVSLSRLTSMARSNMGYSQSQSSTMQNTAISASAELRFYYLYLQMCSKSRSTDCVLLWESIRCTRNSNTWRCSVADLSPRFLHHLYTVTL